MADLQLQQQDPVLGPMLAAARLASQALQHAADGRVVHMQTSMGQAATTLTGLLDMNEEQMDGDSEELVESHLFQARKTLIEVVRTGGDCTAPLNQLLQLKCPISMKYAQLNVRQLLKDNDESVGQLKAIPVALGMLEKYGRHLLKPPGARVEQWRQIRFHNPIFKDRVLPMRGAVEVAKQMGYSVSFDCGLQFAVDEPDPELTSNLVADIVLAHAEMDHYLMNRHPHPEMIHALLPESTIEELLVHWEQVAGAEGGTVSINPAPSIMPQQVLHPPTPVSMPVEEQAAQLSEPQASQSGGMEDQLPSASQQLDDSLHRACDICGETAATCWCRLCDNKQLCDACDDMWHKHPKRQNHKRDCIASLPNSAVLPSDNIMGPFGIRAVNSLSIHGRDSEQSPTPVSSAPSAGNHRESNSRTPPPQQRQPTPPPQAAQPQQQQQQPPPTSAQASLQQHQQQLQFYLQQQQLLQQQQQQQQLQGFSTMGDYQAQPPPFLYGTMGANPSGGFPQESFLVQTTQGQPGNEKHLAAVSAPSAPYPPFPVLGLNLTSQPRCRDSVGAARPSVSTPQQRSLAHVPQLDYSLQFGQQSAAPGAMGGATAAGYGDLSLRQPARGESVKAFGAAPVTESSMFGPASERRYSGSVFPRRVSSASAGGAASVSESSLLKAVLAESNYEKRAAKCDIRLLTLDEELQEVEGRLNDLMLNSEDFTESADFITLNRSKAVLMKERQALSNYKQELAELMAVEPPHVSDPSGNLDHSPQIFHPPPLSSSPSPLGSFPSPPALSCYLPATSLPQPPPQLGISYPHQASLSPVHSQEPHHHHASTYQPQQQSPASPPRAVYGLTPQSHMGHHAPSTQESLAQSASSSVDRSSILAQWQMNPSVPAAGSAGAGQSQPPLYSPPRYQHTSAPSSTNSPSPLGFVPPATTAEESLFSQLQAGPSAGLPQPSSQQAPDRPSVSPPSGRRTPPLVNRLSQRFDVPGQSWQCSHCTLINDAGTRVCVMCHRTSDNPMLAHHDQNLAGETPATCGEPLQVSLASPPSGAQAPAAAAAAESEVFSASREQLAKIHNRIVEEQDQIYLEKKEAHEQYRRSHPGQSPSTVTLGPPVYPPTPLPLTATGPPPRPPIPPRRNPASTLTSKKEPGEREPVSAQSKGLGKQAAVQQEAVQLPPQQPEEHEEVVGSGGGGGDSGGGGSLDSAFSLMEGDFSMSMERFSEQRKIKQLQLDGADFMHYIKMADRLDFQVEEMQVALTRCQGKYSEALSWLRSEWSKLVQVVVSSTRSEGQQLDQNDVGDLSAEEARKALRESAGDMVAAVKSCVAKRKQLYSRLNPNGTFAREEVLQAMLQSCGDEDAAREQLYLAVLQPFLDRLWQGEGGAGPGEGGGASASRTLLQMTMTESSCQSVATSVITHADFQQIVMDKNVDRDRRIRMILVEGKLKSWGRAEMVIKLLDVDLPASYQSTGLAQVEEPPYTLEDVVEAARNCQDRQSARVYLTQECSTCLSCYPMSKIRNLNFCQCKICTDCLKQNFEVVIREKHVRHWTCPICSLPDLNNTETASEYLGFLQMMLQTLVDKEVYELFDTKVRDWHLQKDPNFRWCAHCGNGFLADEHHLRMVCPHCGDKTCYGCKRQWEDQHEGLTCEQFAQWKIDNDPNNQAVGLARHLEENGIDCPSCKMRYALAKGGCMHFKCPQCGHEFCSGCYMPFYQRGTCPNRQKNCKNCGLHAHHPRDCFFYLRDEAVDRLQSLLREANVQFNTIPPESQEDTSHCPVIEQKEYDLGKSDESCGKDTVGGHAGLCVGHYKEYLVGLINKNHIDPVVIMTVDELKKLLRRREMSCPKMSSNELEANYRKRLIKYVNEKIPLPRRGP